MMSLQSRHPDVVQFEFFHVKFDSLEAVGQECVAQLYEGSPIKTRVRFYDRDSRAGTLVSRFHRTWNAKNGVEDWLVEGIKKKGLMREWHLLRHRFLHKKCSKYRSRVAPIGFALLAEAIEQGGEVTVMEDDFAFLPLRDDEVHELTESASRSSHAWMFLAEHQALEGDELKNIIGSITIHI
ncbi:hypothetical protein COU17_01200 [Candidatus Kaiserbacteria bacterium CG10_big_fil_rev_8_21_14_0_10_49_17]|uniref:Uncharacterized protein n=1 Tax=Candidatus Kaiserbacteria bacterium CG10_big_fil_rev_8_21_14_0_10_49_17 TaxID=1974609 RepID=A0A2M6WEM0_9BACT|nr:MAG: hypothetical protein COU17_01200 [Candidatus Kaiserbacteria bacterium CG10_big_fil_rev_8_21_14_0_10_49_17]